MGPLAVLLLRLTTTSAAAQFSIWRDKDGNLVITNDPGPVRPRTPASAPSLRESALANLVLIHNHPSGDPTPSREDLRLTRQLVDAGQLLDVRIHDHLIIGNGTERWVSLAERGDLS